MAGFIKGLDNNYFITKSGNVYSLRRDRLLVLKPIVNNAGYLQVTLCYKGFRKTVRVHRLLGETYLKNPNNLPFINHKNGNKLDNRLKNLEWCTPSHNAQHAWDTGLIARENHGLMKLKPQEVEDIYKLCVDRRKKLWIAKQFNVSRPTVQAIYDNKIWKHLKLREKYGRR